MSSPAKRPARALASSGLNGKVSAPANKSISHRAILLGGTALGETRISGLLEGEDVLATISAMRAMGAEIEKQGHIWLAQGRGVGGLAEPDRVLDMGNSGTSTRLLMGLIASQPIHATLVGDASLTKRPMERVMKPLRDMGASFMSRGGRLPLSMQGARDPLPLHYEVPVASAQLKSAVLLAGLNAPGITEVVEHKPTRDYTERMLRAFGAKLETETEGETRRIRLQGQPELQGQTLEVSGDPSSAAFMLVAGLVVEDSVVTVRQVGLNPTRTGLFVSLREMGADLSEMNVREVGGQPVADMEARASSLRGVLVPAERAASMIDEYPIMAVAAAVAEGTSRFEGVEELRVKESDRLAATEAMLRAAGVTVRSGPDWMEIEGLGGRVPGGDSPVATHLDHRMAMSALILGLVSEAGLSVDDVACIDTSFPGFVGLMQNLGARIQVPG